MISKIVAIKALRDFVDDHRDPTAPILHDAKNLVEAIMDLGVREHLKDNEVRRGLATIDKLRDQGEQ